MENEPKLNVAVAKDTLGKRGDAPSRVTDEPVVSIKKNEEFNIINYQFEIERELKKYFNSIMARDNKNVDKMLSLGGNREGRDTRVLRLPEASFQNKMLRLVYQNKIALNDNLERFIKSSLAKEYGEKSIEKQEAVFGLLRGVESTFNAVKSLENQTSHPKELAWLATNDEMDARYAIDLIQGFQNDDGLVETLSLVQVKSLTSKEKIDDIVKIHQEYINSLPTLISILSKKEAIKNSTEMLDEIEQEEQDILNAQTMVLSLERKGALSENEQKTLDSYKSEIEVKEKIKTEQEDGLIVFSMIFEQFIEEYQNQPDSKITAQELINYYKNEGGNLNSLRVAGMISSKESISRLKGAGIILNTDDRIEKLLIKTVNNIEFSKKESIEYYREHHEHTLLDTASIYSVVMEGTEVVGKVKISHPLELLDN